MRAKLVYDHISENGRSYERPSRTAPHRDNNTEPMTHEYRGGHIDSFDGELIDRALFSMIDGTNCSHKAVLACRSVNHVFISFSV